MKKLSLLLMLFVVLLLLAGACAAKDMEASAADTNDSENSDEAPNSSSDQEDNGGQSLDISNIPLPKVNMTEVGKKLENATQTGIEPVDDMTSFLANASPFLLLIAGLIIIFLAGFGKIIGIVLIILAVLRLIQMLFF
jgi:ABC-type glycerol-3-phosphate transport system substrate-binding protein